MRSWDESGWNPANNSASRNPVEEPIRIPAWASARLGRIFEKAGGQLDRSGAGSSNDGVVQHMPRSGCWDGVGHSSEYMIAFCVQGQREHIWIR